MHNKTHERRPRLEYVARLVDHDGLPVFPGSPAWEKLSERVSAMWGEAIAWRRDHSSELEDTPGSPSLIGRG